jgi:hypothetical protein
VLVRRAGPARRRHHRQHRRTEAAERTEADMTTPPTEPDSGTPADRAAGAMDEDEYLGRDGGADGGADSGAAGPGSGAGDDDPTTEGEEDSRFA